jgi:hypothetical protein
VNGIIRREPVEQGVARLDQLIVTWLARERYIRGRNESSQELISREKLMVWKRKQLKPTIREKCLDIRRRNSSV